MNKINKYIKYSVLFNISILLIIFFQKNIIINILSRIIKLDLLLIESVVNNNMISLFKNRIIFSSILLVSFILIEIILFFVINTSLSRKLKQENINNLSKYHKLFNYFMLTIIIAFIATIIFYLLGAYNLFSNADFSSNSPFMIKIIEILKNINLTSYLTISESLNQIAETIKSDNNLYLILERTVVFYKKTLILKNIWYLISYCFIFIGLILNVKIIKNIK